jgi:YHS domain-containing protein/predicted acylesterase/phospholipase RssA
VNALPVDVAAMADPDLVVAVRAGGHGPRSMPNLRRPRTVFSGIEILIRATEIALDRQSTLATAMVESNVLVDVKLGDIGLRDFNRLDEAVSAGREAAREALPALRRALRDVKTGAATTERLTLHVDPVCDMMVSSRRAAAVVAQGGQTLFFCSVTCRDTFLRRGTDRPAPG